MDQTRQTGESFLTEPETSRFGRCACFNLRRAARAVTRFYDRILAPAGLRATQFTILMVARRKGPVTLTDLAELLVTERTTVSRNVSLLAGMGFIRHESGNDKRQRLVGITYEGLRALEAAVPYWEKAQAHMQAGLGEGRLDALLDALADATNAVPDFLDENGGPCGPNEN